MRREKMKLREALKTLNEKALFDLNYNYNKDNWELTIFNKDFDIIEEYNNKLLKNILSEFLKEKIENEDSNEFWYLENGYLKFQVNFDNTDDTDNFFRIELLDTYFDNDEKIKDLSDLINRLSNLDRQLHDCYLLAEEVLFPEKAYL
jgi:hypothetical protein